MKRIYIYLFAIIISIGIVISVDFIERDLANVSPSTSLDSSGSGKYIIAEEDEGSDFNTIDVKTDLVITNSENDTLKTEYTYTLKIENVEGAYRYTKENEENYLIFDATGKTSFTLKGNEKITIYDLPTEVQYTITQSSNEEYVTKINNETSTTITDTLQLGTTITFTNTNKNTSNEINNTSPNTVDDIKISILVLALTGLFYIIIKHFKIKQYEKVV